MIVRLAKWLFRDFCAANPHCCHGPLAARTIREVVAEETP